MIWIQNFLRKFSGSLLALIKVFFISKLNTKIKYSHKDRGLVILGNGPSLTDLVERGRSFIADKDLICVNFFPLTSLFERIKPSIFITSAPELWLNDTDDIYIEKRTKLFIALGEKTKWPLILLIPFSARNSGNWQKLISENKNIEIVYYNNTGVEGFESFIFWLFKMKLAMPRPQNVLVPAIFNAINMGYQNIYLWGAENNQFLEMSVDNENNALINQKHFYDEGQSKPARMRKPGKKKRLVHEVLHKFMLSFESYHTINDYALSRGVRVINQTPGSMIDAFEREVI